MLPCPVLSCSYDNREWNSFGFIGGVFNGRYQAGGCGGRLHRTVWPLLGSTDRQKGKRGLSEWSFHSGGRRPVSGTAQDGNKREQSVVVTMRSPPCTHPSMHSIHRRSHNKQMANIYAKQEKKTGSRGRIKKKSKLNRNK